MPVEAEVSIHAPAWGATIAVVLLLLGFPSFNPRSRVGSDATPVISAMRRKVSIHAPAWGATEAKGSYRTGKAFQSTLPRGERPPNGGLIFDESGFNPRSRVGSDAPAAARPRRRPRFNPRSRVGSDISQARVNMAKTVSIHAPAWGATHCRKRRQTRRMVSIHAPAWGATGKVRPLFSARRSFNPRSRVGSDPGQGCASQMGKGFNPRSRVGSDCLPGVYDHPIITRFQSTLPRGERHDEASTAGDANASFNPRSRVGSDKMAATVATAATTFQSTLPRGERPTDHETTVAINLFQSTLPRGERPGVSCRALP